MPDRGQASQAPPDAAHHSQMQKRRPRKLASSNIAQSVNITTAHAPLSDEHLEERARYHHYDILSEQDSKEQKRRQSGQVKGVLLHNENSGRAPAPRPEM